MRMIFGFILGTLLAAVGVAIILGSFRTLQTKMSPNQKLFIAGKAPTKLDGLYRGSVSGYKQSLKTSSDSVFRTNWQGKKFDASRSAGINIFKDGDTTNQRYPFKTYSGKGVTDNMEVLKIDYSENKSPWWLRFILDELVEVEPGKYLGKIHIIAIPGLPFTVGYFTLIK